MSTLSANSIPLIARVADPALCLVQDETVAMEIAEFLFRGFYLHTPHYRMFPHTAYVIITDTGRGWLLSWPGYTCDPVHRHCARLQIVAWARERGLAHVMVSPRP